MAKTISSKKISRDEIYKSLVKFVKDTYGTKKNEIAHYLGLVDDYMEYFDLKENLIMDIKVRGVMIEWQNSETQSGSKRNDSIPEVNRATQTMLKILTQLGLKPQKSLGYGDDIGLL